MKTKYLFTAATCLSVVCLSLAGCSKSDSSTETDSHHDDVVVIDEMPPMLDDHAHPEHGPHGGDLIELGKEDFHAELVHGEQGITIYVLDGAAKTAVAIPSPSVAVSLKHDGSVESFTFAADRQAEDPAENASRFSSTDPKLVQWIDAGAEGNLMISIEGKSYNGKLSHDHDHAGHDH
ncbi:hypothetical protein NHH03_07825 [Stieleria sp. TO1_6]|uniref:hypothetical protein n=1 Tax=Stieleria tagensis TaxID=2956795 RepID=UPI00209ABC0E|nr:hypothetical protein [Stieleria tagensis]MCO8121641.1 hypothetical protein [Stieleria tagensis]